MAMNGDRSFGFTLLEMILTIALLAVVITIAAPSFTSFIQRQAINSDIQRFKTLFTSARSLAMTTNAGLSRICWNPTNSSATVEGITVPAQTIASYSFTTDATPVAVLEATQSIIEDQTVYSSNEGASGCFGFNSQGRLTDTSNATIQLRICREAGNTDDSLQLEVLGTGRVTVSANTTC